MNNPVVVTCGDYDLKTALYWEIKNKNLKTPPSYLHSWINIKIPFSECILKTKENKAGGMRDMLKKLKIPLEGQHHSGLDDCKNISNILRHLIKQKCQLRKTGKRIY
eukprot:TRINITY_DN7982_c0_g1_i1.p1 TRINITY_DN7982_c0_g1~~TRINITY_DN7982_c0_g1_i1.p1  ORF type:complete len:107 (+),score=17.03 TRINITY_DN7982_c0_g1_i1:408-728(+)